MKEKDNDLLIPFSKPARIGNYKIWRSRYSVKDGKEKMDVECVNVSNLDGAWMVRIPSTSQMFGFVCDQYATVDTDTRDKFLCMVFQNMMNICLTPSPALHDALFFLTEMMAFPYLLLSEKEMMERMKKGMKELGFDKKRIDEHIGNMMDYRRQLYELVENKKKLLIEDYERQQALQREHERVSEEEDLKHDDIADEAMAVLQEGGDHE